MQDDIAQATLYVHTLRPQWGLAILTEELPEKRIYLFQDGQVRAFQERFFHMLQPADRPSDVVQRVSRGLQARLGADPNERTVLTRGQMDAVSLDVQVSTFLARYPAGFLDSAYLAANRRGESGKRLKRHVDGVIELAGSTLGAVALVELVEAERWDEIHARAAAVVEGTSLCTPKQRKAVTDIHVKRYADFGQALFDLLHGEGAGTERFARFASLLKDETEASWVVTTLFAGLVFPHEHVVVDAWPFAKQARGMEPQLVVGAEPNAMVYERLRTMAQTLTADLTDRGLPPTDMLDVRAFMLETLSPGRG